MARCWDATAPTATTVGSQVCNFELSCSAKVCSINKPQKSLQRQVCPVKPPRLPYLVVTIQGEMLGCNAPAALTGGSHVQQSYPCNSYQ